MKGEHGKVVGSPPLSLAYTAYTNSVSELFKHIVSHRSLHSPVCSISFPSPLAAGEAHHELRLTGRSVGVYLLSFFFVFFSLWMVFFDCYSYCDDLPASPRRRTIRPLVCLVDRYDDHKREMYKSRGRLAVFDRRIVADRYGNHLGQIQRRQRITDAV